MFIAGDKEMKTYSWSCSRCSASKPIAGNTVVFEVRKHDAASSSGGASQLDRFLTMDPTLPRKQMPCPNEQCPSHGEETEVVVVRTNHARMEYKYICTECKHSWNAAV